MIPKERAEQFVGMFQQLNRSKISDYSRIEFPTAKQCALIVVNEIIKSNPYSIDFNIIEPNYAYWFQVKQEIEKL